MSNWVSCQKIVFNLHKAYELNKDLELHNFNYSMDQSAEEILEMAQAIVDAAPDTIVILDHKPHPLALLQYVLPFLEHKKPKIVFHLFGDFTLFYSHWENLAELMKGLRVEFLVASERQKDLIDKFLPENRESHICPFPVEQNEFSYTPHLRSKQRIEWGLSEDDVAYLFTGRLSRQKRIHTLLRSFSEFLLKTNQQKAHLFLYGNTDSIGDQFVGKKEIEGEYFRKINRIYKSLPIHIQSRIHFMGSVPNSALKSVYHGADILMNLSVHNDEDYGMSVAEAQCTGLPAILTDWGGLASFKHDDLPQATKFIPVKIGRRNKLIHYDSIITSMLESHPLAQSQDRQLISQKALERFNIEAVQKVVAKVIANETSPFQGFSPFFHKVTRQYRLTKNPYLNYQNDINQLYRGIYSSYVRNS